MAPKVALFFALSLLFAVAVHGCGPNCSGQQPPPPVVHGQHYCPINALNLGVCANVLDGLLNVKIGVPEYDECCPLLEHLLDFDAAVCLCTAVRAKVLGIGVDVLLNIQLLLNHCGKKCPSDFACPPPY